jgi:hypothetical protein
MSASPVNLAQTSAAEGVRNVAEPKAFVSHASEDKARFVLSFASLLRANGVDAWLDRWEMAGGDSLVQRIFDEGIAEADAIVVVISKYSVSKPWVREELDAAVVKRITDSTRLLPILLDDVDVPPAVRHLLRYDVTKLGEEGTLDGVLRTLFGATARPPLGNPLAYVRSARIVGRRADPIDDLVLTSFLERFRTLPPNTQWQSTLVKDQVVAEGISEDAFTESLTALVSDGLVIGQRMLGGQYLMEGPGTRAWLDDEERHGVDLDDGRRRVLSAIVNDDVRGIWTQVGDLHWRTLSILLSEFQSDRLLQFVETQGGPFVRNVSPLAARHLRNMA